MKNILLILLLISQLGYSNDLVEISILTCSPGKDIHTAFGHSSIRIASTELQIDQIYNFGMFDFNTSNFAYKFLKGNLKYSLGMQPTDKFIEIYTNEGRTVSEQVLDLTAIEKKNIIDRLLFLSKPENKYYYYAFLTKDCSTELRDLLDTVGVEFGQNPIKKTYRQLISPYLEHSPWMKLAVNLILGKSVDNKTTSYGSMFLPDHLKEEISASFINGKKLVKSENLLNEIRMEKKSNFYQFLSPLIIFSFLALLFLFWLPKSIKLILSSLIAIIGTIIMLLMLFSDHGEFSNNLNILWCNPLYFLYIPLFIKNKTNIILTSILTLGIIATIFIWIFAIQIFDVSTLPLLIILGILNAKELRLIAEKRSHTH